MRRTRFLRHGSGPRSIGGATFFAPASSLCRVASLAVLLLGLCTAPPSFGQDVLLAIDGDPFNNLRTHAPFSDLDGDGVADLLAGLPAWDEVRLYSGSTGGMLMQIVYPSDASFGASVAAAGDFDGDGVPDIVVGAPNDHTAGTYRGSVHVHSGANGAQLASMYGEFYEESLGNSVAGLGDLDLDGYDDVGVASRYHRRVRIYGGPEGHLIRHHGMGGTGNGWRVPSIASIGDVDLDGVPDYAIGWPTDSTGGAVTGTVVVFSGRGGTPIHEVHGITPWGGGLIGSHLGLSVAGVGDIDGDGIPDFAAGAPGQVSVGPYPPPTQAWVRVYSGKDAHVLHHWEGGEQTVSSVGAYFGFWVAGGGDLNADGVPDVLAGAPTDGGSGRGTVSVFSGRTGERLWRPLGTDSSSRMHHCAVVGDLDGDGLSDFATGDLSADFGGHNAGRITVYAGAPGDLERHCSGDPAPSRRTMRLEMSGALGIGNNYLTLFTSNATPGGIGIFVYGPLSPPLPFGGGWQCTGPPVHYLAPPLPVDSTGHVEHLLDFTQPPLSEGPGEVLPGSTWSFQLYCRDPSPSGTGPRLSDGLAITFPP